jgi:hypothetical protein
VFGDAEKVAMSASSTQSRMNCGSTSAPPRKMGRDNGGLAPEDAERFAQRTISFGDGSIESVVGGQLARRLPYGLHRVELGRIGRKAKQCDPPRILMQPTLSVLVEAVARPVVDDEEHLATAIVGDELLEEREEGSAVENFLESIVESCAV